jgi:hypothetical protein
MSIDRAADLWQQFTALFDGEESSSPQTPGSKLTLGHLQQKRHSTWGFLS